jgi:mono/diheme cytochrome c family protein
VPFATYMRPTRFFLPALFCLATAVSAASTAKENFESHCVDCHGENGKSQTRLGRKAGAKDLSDKNGQAKLTDEEIFKTIKFGRKDGKGREKMDAFSADLSDTEITELVAFVRTLAK